MAKVINSVNSLDFSLSDLRRLPPPDKVLLVKPTYFDVEYIINPHMKGNIGEVDKLASLNEWEHLASAYREIGLYVHVVNGVRGYPDMVFCANQSLPYITEEGSKKVIMSVMHTAERKGEVPHLQKVYEESSYEIVHLDESKFSDFEGMGDGIWHFKRALLWGGYGFRTSPEVYDVISDTFQVPVITLELKDEKFYHLDTCFCILDDESVMIYPPAFTSEGLALIKTLFTNILEASKYEAERLFACNANSPDGKNVFIQQGCTDMNQQLRSAGFKVHEFSTNEFLKSGGSVYCMKMMLW